LRLDRKLGITAGKQKIEDSFLEIFHHIDRISQ
jgi:hypothetical protein